MSDQRVCKLHFNAASWYISVGHSEHENEPFSSVTLRGSLLGPIDEDYHRHADKLSGARCFVSLSSAAHQRSQLREINQKHGIENTVGGIVIKPHAAEEVSTFEGETFSSEGIHAWLAIPEASVAQLISAIRIGGELRVALSVLVPGPEPNFYVSPGELYRKEQAGYPLVGYSVSTSPPVAEPAADA